LEIKKFLTRETRFKITILPRFTIASNRFSITFYSYRF